jgi:hypothetical protein
LVEQAIGVPADFQETWPAFEKSVHGADCAVPVIEWLRESPGAAELEGLRVANPWTRFVLVTRVEAANARVAPNLADSIVWIRDARAGLGKAVQTPRDGLRGRMARQIRDHVACPKWTKVALLEAATADPPIRTVGQWARRDAIATTTRTLERWLARDFACGITAKFLLDSMLLLWARDALPSASSWVALGNHADADAEMLKETALKLIGASASPDAARLLRQSTPGRRVSPAMIARTILAEGLAALMRPR